MSSQDQTTQTPTVGIGMNSPAVAPTQPAPATADAAAQASRQPVLSDDNLACQWDQCKERCQTAEALYEHICERHVGRKSTNNLNLTCGWTNCRTTTVKRDHITSHIRVHVPLKPHKCTQCGKSFKRPQDLKKHIKTHADDSVLVRSPDGHTGPVGGYRQPNGGRDYAAGPSGGYYEPAAPHMQQPNGNYGQPQHHAGGHNGYYQPQPQGYGMGYYPQVQHGGDMGQHNAAAYEQSRRSQALGDFFGDVKAKSFNPGNYPEIGQRLMALNAAGINGQTLVDYMTPQQQQMMAASRGGPQVATMAPQHYSLPIPNLKSRADLMTIDTFLDQMQGTIYESANQAAAAGIHQPGAHYTHQTMGYRQSHSPPAAQQNIAMTMSQQAPGSTHTAPMSAQAHSPQSSTPALTPPSGNVSYTSGQSPVSAPGLSPTDTTRHASTSSAGYPVLPAVSSVYAPHSSASPASTLGTNFDSDPRKRFSGGMLQKAAGPRYETPSYTSHPPNFESKKLPVPTSSNIDPALSGASPGVTSPGASSDSDKQDEVHEQWIDNIRVIELLGKLVKARIQELDAEEQKEQNPLYPVLKYTEGEN